MDGYSNTPMRKVVERKLREKYMKGNTNDMKREAAAKPNGGVVKVAESKGDYACPQQGGTVHTEKVVAHERGNVANPSASGPHATGKDPKNVATPKSGVHDERKDQKRFDENHDELKRKRL